MEKEQFLLVAVSARLLQDVKYIQTDGYRAPEAELQNCMAQAGLQSDPGCTSAVDLWSLGIILLEMFSGVKLKHTIRSQEWKVTRAPFQMPGRAVIPGGDCPASSIPHSPHSAPDSCSPSHASGAAGLCADRSWAQVWCGVNAGISAFSQRSKSDFFCLVISF